MVQFVKKEVQQPASVQAQEEKKVKTFDEKYGTTARSRTGSTGTMWTFSVCRK
jgi:hypothetical protein